MAIIFKGFHSPVVGKTEVLFDKDIVRQDLINHFNTKPGERVMDVSYGFIGWDLLFELDNQSIKQMLDTDARRIIALDPRLLLKDIEVLLIDYGYRINILLEYVQLDSVEELSLVFDARSNTRMASVSTS